MAGQSMQTSENAPTTAQPHINTPVRAVRPRAPSPSEHTGCGAMAEPALPLPSTALPTAHGAQNHTPRAGNCSLTSGGRAGLPHRAHCVDYSLTWSLLGLQRNTNNTLGSGTELGSAPILAPTPQHCPCVGQEGKRGSFHSVPAKYTAQHVSHLAIIIPLFVFLCAEAGSHAPAVALLGLALKF